MAGPKKRLRPTFLSVGCMMLFNLVITLILLPFMLKLFGISIILPQLAAAHAWAAGAEKLDLIRMLLPGAAIGYGILWFWLIITGRTNKGLPWAGAIIYGVIIALCDVPLSGLLSGIENGTPLMGMLIGLVIMILVPSIAACMVMFGVLMGLMNGHKAQKWIDRWYVGNDI